MKEISHTHYLPHKQSMLRDFDRVIAKVQHIFVERYGQKSSERMIQEARQEYEMLLPGLPYIGGKQPFTQFIITAAWFLAMYRTLQKQGVCIEEAGKLVYEIIGAFMRAYPQFVLRFLGFMSFSWGYLRKLQQRALESQERNYSEAYHWGLQRTMTIAEGDEKCDFRFKQGGETCIVSSVLKLE